LSTATSVGVQDEEGEGEVTGFKPVSGVRLYDKRYIQGHLNNNDIQGG